MCVHHKNMTLCVHYVCGSYVHVCVFVFMCVYECTCVNVCAYVYMCVTVHA